KLIEQAFAELQQADVVFGPTQSGGCYLIGLKKFYAPLFRNVAWSNTNVLSRARTLAEQLGLRFLQLPECAELDTVHDLKMWQAQAGHEAAPQTKISVIIPTYNHAASL